MLAPETKLRLKFKDGLPPLREFQLVHKYGFTFMSRKEGEWVMYTKTVGQKEFSHGLSETAVKDLTKRVNRIVEGFSDPDSNKDIIKVRCLELAKMLDPKQEAWVKNWVKYTIDEEDDDGQIILPWTDADIGRAF